MGIHGIHADEMSGIRLAEPIPRFGHYHKMTPSAGAVGAKLIRAISYIQGSSPMVGYAILYTRIPR